MKNVFTYMIVALVAFCGVAHGSDALVEKITLLRVTEELEMADYELVEVLQEYNLYREQMDGLTTQRAEKAAALEAALAAEDSAFPYAATNRELMDLDMRMLRMKQMAVNDAGQVMPANIVSKLYLAISDPAKAKADLVAELTGATMLPCGMPAPCPLAAKCAAVCPLAAEPAAECPAAAEPAVAPEDAVKEQCMLFMNKIVEKKIEEAGNALADDFDHHEYGGKEDIAFFLEQALFMGYLDDLRVVTDDTEIKFEGDKAKVYPIDLQGTFGSVTLELILENRDGKWQITGMDAVGL